MLTNSAAANTPEELNIYVLQLEKDDNFKFELLEHCKGCVTSESTDNKKDTLRKSLAMLKYIDKELSNRGSLVKNRLGRKSEDINIHIYNKKFPKEKLPVIQLWIDEAASMYVKSTDKEMNKMFAECQDIIERIARAGRYIGIYLVNILQRASKEELPRAIKTNTMNWISFRQVDAGASKVAIGDETSALGLPQRVFVFKAGGESISLAKTPFTKWDDNVKYLEKQNKIREDNQDVFDDVYSVWWSRSIDRNKESIAEAKSNSNSKGNVIESKALKMFNDKLTDANEMINEMKYINNQKDETITKLANQVSDLITKLEEQNKIIGRMVKDSATFDPGTIEQIDQISINTSELTPTNYKNIDTKKNAIEELDKSSGGSSPYKNLDLSAFKLNKKDK